MKDETDRADASPASLVTSILNHVGALVRKEVDLARAEINENLTKAGIAIGLIIGAVVLSLTALDVLAAALVAAITEFGLDAGWAALIVGVLLALIAWGLTMKGLKELKSVSLAPKRAARSVSRAAKAVKESI